MPPRTMGQRLVGWFRRREGKPQPRRRRQQPQPKAPQPVGSTARVRRPRSSLVEVMPAAPELARAPEEASPAAAVRTNEGRRTPPRARPPAAAAAETQAGVPSAAEAAETPAVVPSAAEAEKAQAVVPSAAEAAETQAEVPSVAEAAKAAKPALQARALTESPLCTGSSKSLPARE